MTRAGYRITAVTRRRREHRAAAAVRGVLAVLALLLSAADALATSLIGIPPVAWLAGQAAAVIRATYRRAAYPPATAPAVITGRVIPPIERKERADG